MEITMKNTVGKKAESDSREVHQMRVGTACCQKD